MMFCLPATRASFTARFPVRMLLAAVVAVGWVAAGSGCHRTPDEDRAATGVNPVASPGAVTPMDAPHADFAPGSDASGAPDGTEPTGTIAATPWRAGSETHPGADTLARPDADTLVRADAASEKSSQGAPDPANKTRPPLASPDLDERASHLLDAIAQDNPATADDFFFPKEPFIPLKDVADPGRYFDQLLATYHRDIRSLRAERRDWTGATFVSFELGTPPTWVAPGKEYNKIGYFRTFGGKLRYRIGDKVKDVTVSTIISWDGRWYVTHLLPIRH